MIINIKYVVCEFKIKFYSTLDKIVFTNYYGVKTVITFFWGTRDWNTRALPFLGHPEILGREVRPKIPIHILNVCATEYPWQRTCRYTDAHKLTLYA